MSTLKPDGTPSSAPGGRLTTRGGLIARTFEPGDGKSLTAILRRALGASPVQSSIAAFPSRTPLSAALEMKRTRDKSATKIAVCRAFARNLCLRGGLVLKRRVTARLD